MAISLLRVFCFLTPKIKKILLPQNSKKNTKFSEFWKNRNICGRATTQQPVCQISNGYLKIWLTNQNFTFIIVPNDKVIFQIHFLEFLVDVHKNKWHHWIPELNLHLIDTFFDKIHQLQNLTFFDLTMTWGGKNPICSNNITKQSWPSNSTPKMTHKTCVTRLI